MNIEDLSEMNQLINLKDMQDDDELDQKTEQRISFLQLFEDE